MSTPVTAIFDIGKTNKKFFLFDRDLNKVHYEYLQLEQTEDDDGFPCEDLNVLGTWMREVMNEALRSAEHSVQALNFSGYGASLVHLDAQGRVATPFYSYLKPFPEKLLREFEAQYGPAEQNDLETGSPTLGMLNAGMQLYWLKKTKPRQFAAIRHTLHFPQYLSYLFTGQLACEPTSVGCHTKLWDFQRHQYHAWVHQEGVDRLFPTIVPASHSFATRLLNQEVQIGVGIHDSSAALVAYQHRYQEPFILLSTGTWNICLNPFTEEPLTPEELRKDCLFFLDVRGRLVKAARLFLGNEFEHQVKRLNKTFGKEPEYYRTILGNESITNALASGSIGGQFYPDTIGNLLPTEVLTPHRWQPELFDTYEEAYHHLVWGLAVLQKESLLLAQGASPIHQVFVDGGFAHNVLFIRMLERLLPDRTFRISSLPMGSAYGAAMAMKPPEG